MYKHKTPTVSLFGKGYLKNEKKKNSKETVNKAYLQTRPERQVSLIDLWKYIRGDDAKTATEELRKETSEEKQREMKILNFKFCTPYGTFDYRKTENLVEESGMMVVDIDDIQDRNFLDAVKMQLIHDTHYVTELIFISPRGHGLKWFISTINKGNMMLKDYFMKVSRYLQFEYGIIIDKSGKDAARACFLSHDPECYINPKYIKK